MGSRGPKSSRFLRLMPDPLLLDMATDDDEVNVIGGTLPCKRNCNFACKFFCIHEESMVARSGFSDG